MHVNNDSYYCIQKKAIEIFYPEPGFLLFHTIFFYFIPSNDFFNTQKIIVK